MTLTKLYAFLWKDWEEARSYKLAYVMESGGIILPLVMLFFMGRLFNQIEMPSLEKYGGNYVSFIMIGIAITTYSGNTLRGFSVTLRRAQSVGTLETLFLTKASLPTLVLGWSLYPFLRATVLLLAFFTGGFLILGLGFDNINVLGVALTIALLVLVMGSLGILAAGFTIVFKRGDPFTALMVMASGLLSGTIYPVEVMPGWLQVAAKALPHTYAIESIRLASLQGTAISDISGGLVALAIYSIILIPISLFAFRYSIHRAKVSGSLAHY